MRFFKNRLYFFSACLCWPSSVYSIRSMMLASQKAKPLTLTTREHSQQPKMETYHWGIASSTNTMYTVMIRRKRRGLNEHRCITICSLGWSTGLLITKVTKIWVLIRQHPKKNWEKKNILTCFSHSTIDFMLKRWTQMHSRKWKVISLKSLIDLRASAQDSIIWAISQSNSMQESMEQHWLISSDKPYRYCHNNSFPLNESKMAMHANIISMSVRTYEKPRRKPLYRNSLIDAIIEGRWGNYCTVRTSVLACISWPPSILKTIWNPYIKFQCFLCKPAPNIQKCIWVIIVFSKDQAIYSKPRTSTLHQLRHFHRKEQKKFLWCFPPCWASCLLKKSVNHKRIKSTKRIPNLGSNLWKKHLECSSHACV